MVEDLNTQHKTTQSEQELQLKKRARRRLVGAIALVLAMLVILPMILDDKATKPQAPITISIPDEDNTNFTSKIVPLPAVDANPMGSALPVVTTPIEKNETGPITSGVDAHNTVNPNTVIAEPIKTEPLKKAPAVTEAKTEKAANNKISASKVGHFVVQIGVFSNADSVKDLQMKLLADGLKTHTDIIKTDKGDKIRLRTGSFDSREAAAEVLNSIKTAGVTGMIVTE